MTGGLGTPAVRSTRQSTRESVSARSRFVRLSYLEKSDLLVAAEFDIFVFLVLDGLDDFEGDVAERAANFALGDALGVFLAVGVEDLHFQHETDERGSRRDERRVERLATRRAASRADLNLH